MHVKLRQVCTAGTVGRLFFLACLGIPGVSQAGFISPSDFGATFSVLAGVTQPTSAYDADTDMYTVNAD